MSWGLGCNPKTVSHSWRVLYEFSHEKCSEIFPKLFEPLFVGPEKFRMILKGFFSKCLCEKNKSPTSSAGAQPEKCSFSIEDLSLEPCCCPAAREGLNLKEDRQFHCSSCKHHLRNLSEYTPLGLQSPSPPTEPPEPRNPKSAFQSPKNAFFDPPEKGPQKSIKMSKKTVLGN